MNKTIRTLLHFLAVLLVFALAFGLRTYAANRLPIDYDEDDYLRAGQEFAHLIHTSDWRGFLDTNYRPEHPQLAKIMFGLSILNLPEEPLIPDVPITALPAKTLPPDLLKSARGISMWWGSLTAALLALINPLGGFLLAIHSFTIKYTSQVMLDGFASLMSTLAALAYYFSKRKDGRAKTTLLILSAIFLGLSASSKYLHSAVGFAILIDWYLSARESNEIKKYFRNAFLWGVLALVAFFIFNPFYWPDPLGRIKTTLEAVSATTTNPNVTSSNFPMWQQLVFLASAVPLNWNPNGILFHLDAIIFVFAILGLTSTWKKDRFLAIWLLVGIFLLLIWRTKWPQYILVATAPLSLVAAEGIKATGAAIADWWRSRSQRREETVKPSRKGTAHALPWLIPGLIAFALLTLVPLIFEIAISMTDFNAASLRDGFHGGLWRAIEQGLTGQIPAQQIDIQTRANRVNFTGLNTYLPVLRYISEGPWSILFFNVMWTVLSVLLQCGLGLGVALLLWQRGVRFSKFWQALFILPWAVPELIGAQMWLNIFIKDWGWLYLAAQKYGPTSFFAMFANSLDASPSLWLITFLLPAMWYGFPFMMLAASVGLKTIPQDVFDASAMDGANAWQTFRSVTLPLLMPLLTPALIVRGIFAFNQFYLFQTYYFQDATLATLSYNVFNPNSGYSNVPGGQFAISAVINIITVIILMVFVLLFNRWSKAGEGVTYA
ncbi:MAG TPA: ABC transporter permease subunit [Anaerolineales bacterium]|nr:ABC transporter permease subunit [Anaerolineales bacterium]